MVEVVVIVIDQSGHTLSSYHMTETIKPIEPTPQPSKAAEATSGAPDRRPSDIPKAQPEPPKPEPSVPQPPKPEPFASSPLDKLDPVRDDKTNVSPGNKPLVETLGWIDPYSQLFADMSVYHHNVHRYNHSAPPVIWNATLAMYAQEWSEKCITEEEM